MLKYTVYELVDSLDGIPRYVGITCDPKRRGKYHIQWDEETNPAKAKWVKERKKQGYPPIMQLIETTDDQAQAQTRERYWIAEYFYRGYPLLNARSLPTMTDTILKQMRNSLGATQEQVLRRTRTVSLSTLKNAESGKRVTHDNAGQILEAINSIREEKGLAPVALDDLGLTLY